MTLIQIDFDFGEKSFVLPVDFFGLVFIHVQAVVASGRVLQVGPGLVNKLVVRVHAQSDHAEYKKYEDKNDQHDGKRKYKPQLSFLLLEKDSQYGQCNEE